MGAAWFDPRPLTYPHRTEYARHSNDSWKLDIYTHVLEQTEWTRGMPIGSRLRHTANAPRTTTQHWPTEFSGLTDRRIFA